MNSRKVAFAIGNKQMTLDNTVLTDDINILNTTSQMIFKICNPIGSIIASVNAINPASYYSGISTTEKLYTGPCGTWIAFAEGRTLVGLGNNGTTDYKVLEQILGDENGITSHTHSITQTSSGGGNTGSVLNHQHNICCDMWGTTELMGVSASNEGVGKPPNYGFAWRAEMNRGNRAGTINTVPEGGHGHTIPNHTHTISNNTTGTARGNMQPSIIIAYFKRMA